MCIAARTPLLATVIHQGGHGSILLLLLLPTPALLQPYSIEYTHGLRAEGPETRSSGRCGLSPAHGWRMRDSEYLRKLGPAAGTCYSGPSRYSRRHPKMRRLYHNRTSAKCRESLNLLLCIRFKFQTLERSTPKVYLALMAPK